ncbi:MAG: tol-pal system protein YbgF [Rickettsiales bacterium]|nr:tol-pal system protein YbgF [Rickettsiales bacterium]
MASLSTAYAQELDEQQVMDRLDKIERDVTLVQRQVSRGSSKASAAADGGGAGNAAQIEVRLTAIEDELRGLRGKMEENEFQIRKLSEGFDKLQRDTEFRFSEIAQGSAAATPAAPATPSVEAAAEKVKPKVAAAAVPAETPAPTVVAKKRPAENPADTASKETTAGDGVLRLPKKDAQDGEKFATPRDLYNHAFRLLNETRYDEAADTFGSFTQKYPKDPLVGNAYYWQGETYYIRRDYINAADHFRQGFEALPEGPKAADNLLKLAMSLDALDRNKEACIVLQQITTKFKRSSISVTEKAAQEQKRIGCK